MLTHTVRPGHDAGRHRLGSLGLGVQVMGGALHQHAPAFARLLVEVVDLEGDPVLGVLDASPQVLIGRAVLRVSGTGSRRYGACS